MKCRNDPMWVTWLEKAGKWGPRRSPPTHKDFQRSELNCGFYGNHSSPICNSQVQRVVLTKILWHDNYIIIMERCENGFLMQRQSTEPLSHLRDEEDEEVEEEEEWNQRHWWSWWEDEEEEEKARVGSFTLFMLTSAGGPYNTSQWIGAIYLWFRLFSLQLLIFQSA